MIRHANATDAGETYFECDLCKVRYENPMRIRGALIDSRGPEPKWLLYHFSILPGDVPHTLKSNNYAEFHICPEHAAMPFAEILDKLPFDAEAERERLLKKMENSDASSPA